MKNYAFTLLGLVILLAACSKDDTPLPEPFKVTRITCLKNGNSAGGFSMTITPNEQDGTVSKITHANNVTDEIKYQSNEIYVFNTNQADITYKLSDGRISSYEVKEKNPHNANAIYTYDKFQYTYQGYYWNRTTMEGNRLDEDGQLIPYKSNVEHIFKWDNSKLVTYTAGDNILEFEYSKDLHPANYPFRILNCVGFDKIFIEGMLVREENFNPMNFLLGNNNRYLIQSVKCYESPNVNIILAKYNFEHTLDAAGYVTNVEITEYIYDTNNTIKTSNTYQVSLTYGYDPNKN